MAKGPRIKRSRTKEIVFDEDARRNFLTGFRKRKNERRQFARNKLAEEVRKERLEERKERRQFKQEQVRGVGSSAADEEAADTDEEEPDSDEEDAERTDYQIGDTVTTTVVSSLLGDNGEMELQKARKQSSSTPPAGRPKKELKKFNLSKPLADVIPGYKPPVGLKKAKKKKKSKVVSKKAKAAARAPERRR